MMGARLAYKQSFQDKVKILNENAESLKVFEAVRNVLAHKGGVADDKFIAITKSHPNFQNIQAGTDISISGDLVKDYATLTVETAIDLIVEVDNYLLSI